MKKVMQVLYAQPSPKAVLGPEDPGILIAAKERLTVALDNLAYAKDYCRTTADANQAAVVAYQRFRNTLKRERQHNAGNLNKTQNRIAKVRHRYIASNQRDDRYRARSELQDLFEVAEYYRNKGAGITEKLADARADMKALRVAQDEAVAYFKEARREELAAQRALRYFWVSPGSFRQLNGEPDDHYQQRLAYLTERRQLLIDQAAIPPEYQDTAVVKEGNGEMIHFYFGGTGVGDHAHYILKIDGTWRLRRPPGRGVLFGVLPQTG